MRSALFIVLALLAVLSFVSASTPKPQRPLCGASLTIDGSVGKTYTTGATTSADQVTVAVQEPIVVAAYAGTVYIYYWDSQAKSLSLKQNLTSNDPASGATFGAALSFANGILVVGHPGWVDPLSPGPQPHGRAVVYQTLSDDTSGFLDFYQLGDAVVTTDSQDSLTGQSNFGAWVSQRNMTLSVSSPQCCSGNRVGAAYTYRFNTTTNQWESARVGTFGDLPLPTPSGIPLNAGFGTAVTFTGQLLLATVPGLNDANNAAIRNVGGIIYFDFDLNTATVPACSKPSCQAKLATWGAYTPDAGAECGAAMSQLDSSSNRVSIGCPGNRNASGTVLIGSVFPPAFSISNRILPPTPTDDEGFGAVVSQNYDSVVVGTVLGDKVYVYERVPIPRSADSYVNTQTLAEASRAQFGGSLSIEGRLLAVGSYGGLDVYDCGNPVKAAAGAVLPLLGLLLLSLALLL